MTKSTASTKSPRAIPASPEQVRETLCNCISACRVDPLFERVVAHVKAHDEAIEAGTTEGKPLAWILQALETEPEQVVARRKTIETAVKVFDGIVKTLEREDAIETAKPEIEMATMFATEIDRWGEGGWQATLEGFTREVRGINPNTLTQHLGFTEAQLSFADEVKEGEPQWATLSLASLVERVLDEPKVLENRAFRRSALGAFAAFFRFAFGQTGSSDQELLDWCNQIRVTLYGEDAVTDDRTATNPATEAKSASSKARAASKAKAKERGTAEYEQRMSNPEVKRGYVQEGGRKK